MPRGEHLRGKGGKLFKKGEPSPNPYGRPKGSQDSKTRTQTILKLLSKFVESEKQSVLDEINKMPDIQREKYLKNFYSFFKYDI